MRGGLEARVLVAGVAGLPALFAEGVRAAEVAEIYLDRIASHNDALNAYLQVTDGLAREAAAACDARRKAGKPLGPLDGVPIALKDNIDLAGEITTGGIGAYGDNRAPSDAFVTRALKDAGAVILGKLNMHEGALGAVTDNAAYGACHNPYRTGYTPGGSSGGSGAAVAAGLCAAALGTDTMGSVRLPAAYCGTAGLKPTTGLVSSRGVMALCFTLDHVGPLARRVADLAPLMAVLGQSDPADPMFRPRPPVRALPKGPAGLTLGRLGEAELDRCEPAVRSAYEAVLTKLAAAGCRLVEAGLADYDFAGVRRDALVLIEADAMTVHRARIETDPDGFTPLFRKLLAYGAGRTAEELAAVEARLREVAAMARGLFQRLDAIVMPTAPQSAFPFADEAPVNQADYTSFANFAGCPAVAVPAGLSEEGLPVSVQIVTPAFADDLALSLAAAIEALVGPVKAPLQIRA